MMTERPILFSTEMVRAILNGRKTQTRRVVKFHGRNTLSFQLMQHNALKCAIPCKNGGYVFWDSEYSQELQEFHDSVYFNTYNGMKCPYGQPGDTLWVRETFAYLDKFYRPVKYGIGFPVYKADHITGNDGPEKIKWKPSIFMPRKFSRINLLVKNVRVERVQDISDTDAYREGVEDCHEPNHDDCFYGTHGYKCSFERLWDKINAKRGYGWDVNPWVWVIELERE